MPIDRHDARTLGELVTEVAVKVEKCKGEVVAGAVDTSSVVRTLPLHVSRLRFIGC